MVERRVRMAGAAVALIIAALTWAGAHDLLSSGIFDWHLGTPALRQGSVELAVAFGLLTLAFRMPSRTGAWIAAVVVATYLRLHTIDLAFFAGTVYVGGIVALGARLSDRYGAPADAFELRLGRSAAMGLLASSLVIWSAGVLGATFHATRWLGIAVALSGWAWSLRRVPSTVRRAAMLWARPRSWTASTAWALLVVMLLAALARSNTVIYYDAIWYGLRPDRVLFGEHGIYSYLGLTMQVHYYPKLYEVAIAPLQGWGDLSLDVMPNVACMLLLVLVVRGIARANGAASDMATLFAVAITAVPACLGTVETTKGDVAAAAFVLLAARWIQQMVRDADVRLMSDVLACAVLATGLRLSSLPYVALLFAATLLGWAVVAYRVRERPFAWLTGRPAALAAASALVLLLVHYRTWLLTGTPLITNSATQSTLETLGFHLRYPIGSLTGGQPPVGLRGLVDAVDISLAPSRFEFHVIKWLGAAWIGFALVAAVRIAFVPGRRAWLVDQAAFIALGLAMPMLLCGNAWQVRGGDGNYFIGSTIAFGILGMSALRGSRALAASLLASGLTGVFMYLLTANWVPGTEPFSPSLTRSAFDGRAQVDRYLDSAGLLPLAEALRTCDVHTRAVGLLPNTGQAFALPIRYEPMQELAWDNSASMQDEAELRRLLLATGTQLVVVPSEQVADSTQVSPELLKFVQSSIDAWEGNGRAREVGRVGPYALVELEDAAPPRGCTFR